MVGGLLPLLSGYFGDVRIILQFQMVVSVVIDDCHAVNHFFREATFYSREGATIAQLANSLRSKSFK